MQQERQCLRVVTINFQAVKVAGHYTGSQKFS